MQKLKKRDQQLIYMKQLNESYNTPIRQVQKLSNISGNTNAVISTPLTTPVGASRSTPLIVSGTPISSVPKLPTQSPPSLVIASPPSLVIASPPPRSRSITIG